MRVRSAPLALLTLYAACSDPAIRHEPPPSAAFTLPAATPPMARAAAAADSSGGTIGPPLRDSVTYPLSRAGDLLLPVVVPDACQGEDCAWAFRGIACAGTELREATSDLSAPVGRVAQGDSVDVDHTELHVVPGIVVLRRDTLSWSRGDTVRLIRYEELGEWHWWHHGNSWSGQEFWRGPADSSGFGGVAGRDTSGAAAIALRHPRTEEWLHVVRTHGASGWWRQGSAGDIRDADAMRHWDESC